jgi:hypothetical protein
MKNKSKQYSSINLKLMLFFFLIVACISSYAQDSTTVIKRVKNTFNGNTLIDNQTVMVPVKNTLEFNFQHRFGTVNKGYSDFYGIFAGANVRLSCNYSPINDLQFGVGLCEEKMQWDGNIKYALSKQAVSNGCPISVTYYGNMAVSTLPLKGNFVTDVDRISYFNQLLFARKINESLSLQVAPSLSYYNNVEGYLTADGTVKPKMNNAHFACAFIGRYMITKGTGIIANYDQPLTQHLANNPRPNISFGVLFATTTHVFQIFVGNYSSILPQANNFFNQNDFTKSQYLIGFNITKRWYY